MKTHAAVSLLLLLAGAAPALAGVSPPAATGEDTFAPKERPITTYDKIRTKSPFEFDAPKPPVDVVANPFEGISLAGYCGSGNTLTVYLVSGKEKKRFTVFGDGSPFKKRDDSGFRVIGINRGASLKSTSVVLERNGQKGTVEFDDDALHSKGAAPQGGVQMIRDQNGNMVPRPVIPRPGGAAAPGGGGQVYQAPPPFIPGQSSHPVNVNQQGMPQGQPGGQINTGVQQGVQPVPPPVNFPATNNNLVQPGGTNTGFRPQGAAGGGEHQGGRRKVVLPGGQ
jgi:hypothetical protein